MSKGPLREDKTCLNCGTTVEERYCPNCGQENSETRKSFHYLFTHFVEDLVHYDSGFWKTLKYLLFFPAKLTREYLSGRRKQFVAPVKLYIFISFVTFFISGFFMITPKEQTSEKEKTPFVKMTTSVDKPNAAIITADTLITAKDTTVNKNLMKSDEYGWFNNYKSVAQYDSIQKTLPADQKATGLQNVVSRKLIEIAEHNTPRQALTKFLQVFKQNIPKVLFLYMPLFAFSLWLFHSKKRWFYFDHGIFTLHYFAFLLLITSVFIVSEELLDFGNSTFTDILLGLIRTAYVLWPIFYFYRAHRRLYGESGIVSFLKGSVVLFLNFVLMILVLSCAMIYTLMGIS